MEPANVIISDNDTEDIVMNITDSNYVGEGAAGKVYRINYYGVQSVAKVPIDETKQNSIKKEIVIYSYLCKIFNHCSCSTNLVQMLGYNNSFPVLMLEYFDGSDLTKYTGYPVDNNTFNTHRLQPRSIPGNADFITLGYYLKLSGVDHIILHIFDHIASGLICLHMVRISHRDLELKNILIRSDSKIGITDFGSSRLVDRGSTYDDFTQLLGGFKIDTDNLGLMMGNFIDSTNQFPYQFRIDTGEVDNFPLYDKIMNPALNDAFLLLTEFKDLVAFVSTIYYVNKNTERDAGLSLMTEAIEYYNDIISNDSRLSSEDKRISHIPESKIIEIVDNIYQDLKTDPSLMDLIRYFRLIVNNILVSVGSKLVPDNISVYSHIREEFSNEYPQVIILLSKQLDYGFHLYTFDSFIDIFKR